MKRYKFIAKDFKSVNGNQKWEPNKWYKYDGDLDMCHSGFHCSKGIYQAFSYVQGEILVEVEVKGNHQTQNDKEVWEQMRVAKAYEWTKTDSILFAIFAARLVLGIFERYDKNDKRPREAIEAAERYVENPTEENRNAADAAADAAYAAYAAYEAAHAAAYAATIYKKCDAWMLEHLKELRLCK